MEYAFYFATFFSQSHFKLKVQQSGVDSRNDFDEYKIFKYMLKLMNC